MANTIERRDRIAMYAVGAYMIPWIAAVNWLGRGAAIAYAFFHFGVIFCFAIWLSLPFRKK
jgi:hypothetical protein